MLLAVDIGNTNITYGLIAETGTVVGTFRITTKMQRTSDEYGMTLMSFLHNVGAETKDINDVIISSVVPKIMYAFTNSIRKYLLIEPIIIGPGVKTGISVKMESPKEIGADKIVDAAAVYALYGGDALIIDFGTATTYDYIDENGCYLCGVISPGIEISASALWKEAAKLPEVEIRKPASILAKNTITSMQAGIVYGYIGQVEYIVNRFKKELNRPNMKVIATGGLGKIIYKETKAIDNYDSDLTFKGLKIIYDKNKEN